ncbi:hypothetical protein HN51_063468 [Arachis hypogaea]
MAVQVHQYSPSKANKRIMQFFHKDGYNWRKKSDRRIVGEAHERLKIGNVEILNCYYAHREENRSFQKRSYWILDPCKLGELNFPRLRLVLLVQTVRFYRRSLWIGFAPKESQVLFPASSNMNSFFPAMTKIVGTPDPKSRSIDTISRCLDAGISVSRFDLSCENPNTTKRHWKT